MAAASGHLVRGIRATTSSTGSCSMTLKSCSLPLKRQKQLIERDHIYRLGKLDTLSYLGKLKKSVSPLKNRRQGTLSFWQWWGSISFAVHTMWHLNLRTDSSARKQFRRTQICPNMSRTLNRFGPGFSRSGGQP